MHKCQHGKGSVFSCGVQMTDTISSTAVPDSNNTKAVSNGSACGHDRKGQELQEHDFTGFDSA